MAEGAVFERSQYLAGFYPQQNRKGDEVLTIVVKRTYDIDFVEAICRVSDSQEPIVLGDEYNGDEDPFKSSVKYESEIAPWKIRQDVVFVGVAHAPSGEPTPTFDVTLKIGPHRRTLRIFGPRVATWVEPPERKKGPPEPQPPLISDPEPITDVELTYENAYGGFATLVPEDPEAFRKAVKTAKKKQEKKQEKKEEEKKKKEEEKKRLEEEEKKEEQKRAEAARNQAFFSDGTKDAGEMSDESLEAELGSAHKKSADGTLILDLAEIAEAEKREAQEAAAEAEAEAARAAALEGGPQIAADGALVAEDLVELGEIAEELTEEADDEFQSYERQRLAEEVTFEDGAVPLARADAGDAVLADDAWLASEKKKRDDLYASLGQDPNEQVTWEDGEFPRIPCPTNFVGKGFALRNCAESLNELALPLIENPRRLLRPEDLPQDPAMLHLPVVPVPAGWGYLSKGWVPRAYQAGILPTEAEEAQHKMDKRLLEELDAEDEDDQAAIDACLDREPQVVSPLFYNGAHPDWQLGEYEPPATEAEPESEEDEPEQDDKSAAREVLAAQRASGAAQRLEGGEDVTLTNLDESGQSFFKLPQSRPMVRFDRGEGWEPVAVTLDTLVINRPDEKLFLIWRGEVGYGGLEELGDYPRVDIDVQDIGLLEWRDRQHQEAIDRALRDDNALKLGEDEVSDDESAAFEHRIEQAGIGLGGIKEEGPRDLKEVRAQDGALVDLQDREDVVLADDAWIGETRDAQLTDEERREMELERDERKRVKAEKEALRKQREEQKKKKAEEEAAAAEEAKKKKKKTVEEPPEEDDDDDPVEPDPEPTEPEPVKAAPKSSKTSEVAKKTERSHRAAHSIKNRRKK